MRDVIGEFDVSNENKIVEVVKIHAEREMHKFNKISINYISTQRC